MHALTPRAIRLAAGISVRSMAKSLGIWRKSIDAYELSPELVKTPALRWLLDRYYDRLAGIVAATAADRKMRASGGLDFLAYPTPDAPAGPVAELPHAA